MCKVGYGYYQSVCSICPAGYFQLNGYCVTCPVYSSYNALTNKCDCAAGYAFSNNRCVPTTCPANQVFNTATNSCGCPYGLVATPSTGVCAACPVYAVYNPATGTCSSCTGSQILQNGQCVCQPTYGITANGGCAKCETINAYLLNGYCVTCPGGRTWVNGACACPSGQREVNGVCTSQCTADQLVDANGYCYYCQITEIISNGACVCRPGYVRDPQTRFCLQTSCPTGQYFINGICGICVLGTTYDPQLKSCICPAGSYMNGQGVCEQRVQPPVVCLAGFYLGANSQCLPCAAGCATCTSAIQCTLCSDLQSTIVNGVCQSRRCGNGVVEVGEDCDDGNNWNGDGCNAICRFENGYTCIGSPSICRPIQTNLCGNGLPDPGETCDDRNNLANDGCSATCQVEQGWTCTPAVTGRPSVCTRQQVPSSGMTAPQVIVNSVTVYVTLLLDQAYTFSSVQEMNSFIQYQIVNGPAPSSGYCRQRSTDLRSFDCLFNYPGGVSTTPFSINFSYSRNGVNGFLNVPISPTASKFFSRRLN